MGILALDLGSKTGWALSLKNNIFSGTESFHNDRFSGGGMRFLKFQRWLDSLNTLQPGLREIYFEEVRRHLGTDAAHVYGGLLAILTSWCEEKQIPYQGVPVTALKKFITGKGNASKEEIITEIRKRGHHPHDDNEADALALLHWRLNSDASP